MSKRTAIESETQISNLKKDNQRLLQESIRLANSSLETGNQTLTTLRCQGEQFQRTQETVYEIEGRLLQSENILRRMDSTASAIVHGMWHMFDKKKPPNGLAEDKNEQQAPLPAQVQRTGPSTFVGEAFTPAVPQTKPCFPRTDEDDGLAELSNILSGLKNVALKQRDALETQDAMLDNLASSVEKQTVKLQALTKKADKVRRNN